MNFRPDYARHCPELYTTLEEILADDELLRMSGYEQVINSPGVREHLLINPPSIHAEKIMGDLGVRLRKALGEEAVFDRSGYGNAPFSVPNYHSYVEGLDGAIWKLACTGKDSGIYGPFFVVPYCEEHDGWRAPKDRSGVMCKLLSPYEYCHEYWDRSLNGGPCMKHYVPHLFDDGTFGVWLGVLPQPVSLTLDGRTARLSWAADEPRVRRSVEMGRYTLPDSGRSVEVEGVHWRHARALALVCAFEKMAANEPADRYKSKMLAERAELDKKFA